MSAEARRRFTPRTVFGLFMVVAGLLLLADRAAWFEAGQFLRYWPIGVIALGLSVLTQAMDPPSRISGWTLLGIGVVLLIGSLATGPLRPWQFFWPIILIMIGINLMMRGAYRRSPDGQSDPNGRATMVAALGGVTRRWGATPFHGAELTSVMGGCELDLRQAVLAPGDEAVIELFTVMGGHQIRVPDGWGIINQTVPIMGGVDDRSHPPHGAHVPTLVIRGFVLMGGIEIKN